MSVNAQFSDIAVRHDDLAAQRGVPSLVWRAGQQRRFEMILRWGFPAGHKHVQRILEEGCGTGTYVRALLPYADELCGIDVEPEYLQKAVESLPTAHLQLAVCEQLPYADNYFDIILNHEVIEHVEDDRGNSSRDGACAQAWWQSGNFRTQSLVSF